jgi:hypothetical protein
MRNPETMLRVYEELANRFTRQHEPRFRDHCLVLAADAALAAGRAEEAERLRQRLLEANPHHLLRPYASMAEAVQAPDVQEYVADLRRQWPPEFVQKLYLGGPNQPPADEPIPVAAPAVPRKPETVVPRQTEPVPKDNAAPPRPAPAPVRAVEPALPPRQPPVVVPLMRPAPVVRPYDVPEPPVMAAAPAAEPVGRWLATMLLVLGVAGGLGLFFIAFVWPLLEYR